MPARCLPPRPRFVNDAERRVWTALRAGLGDRDVLLANLRFTGAHDGSWEVDLVALLPDLGFATVEVKGGRVWREGGEWYQRTPGGVRVLDLDAQAASEAYLVRRYLRDRPQWRHGTPRMVHLIALPDVDDVDQADLGPGLPRERVITRRDLPRAADVVRDALAGFLHGEPRAAPGDDAVESAVALLAGRGDPQRDVAGLRQVADDHVRRLTDEQHRLLDLARALPRFQVIGGPGTGKTFLGVEAAGRLAEQGRRVAFVAYSRGLTTWVRRLVDDGPRRRRDVVVTTFHGLGHAWGIVPPDDADQHHWDEVIPRQMLDRAVALPPEQRFDALVVDEAQDFGPAWWPPLLAALRDPDDARVVVLADSAQRVFRRGRDAGGVEALDLPVLSLRENLRNSGPIGGVVNALYPEPMRLLGVDGPAVRFVACHAGEAVGAADDAAVALLDEGWRHGDVAVLTTHHRHPLQVEAVQVGGRDGYWDLFWQDTEFFYSTVAGFKGLERPAVVLAVDGFRDPRTARDTLLVGLSRARDLLVVCGDPDVLRDVGGDPCATRLGIRW